MDSRRGCKPGSTGLLGYRSEALGFLRSDVDHPLNAKLVGDHTKLVAPWCVVEGHGDGATVRKLFEVGREFCRVVAAERHAHSGAGAVFHAVWRVGGHKRNAIISF